MTDLLSGPPSNDKYVTDYPCGWVSSRGGGGGGVDVVGEPGELVGVGRGQHPVAQVEDVAGCRLPGLDDLVGPGQHHLGRCEHQGRVEVALHGPAARPSYAVGEGHPPVDAHDVGPGLPHQAEQLAGADPEVDPGHAELACL